MHERAVRVAGTIAVWRHNLLSAMSDAAAVTARAFGQMIHHEDVLAITEIQEHMFDRRLSGFLELRTAFSAPLRPDQENSLKAY